jgi:hypothetical protein
MILNDTMQHYTTVYKTIRHHTTLYNVIQDYTTIYKAIRHCTTLYNVINYTRLYMTLCKTIQHYTTLIDDYYTRLYNYKTKQDYTTLYKTIRHYTTLYVISMFSFVVELIVIYPVPVSRALISSLQSFSRFSS